MKTLQEIKIDIVQGQKPYYVYLLYKPDGTPFYVGKGRSNRVSAHEAETRYFMKGKTWKGINAFKLNTINKIWENNQKVYYEIDSWHDINEDAGNREIDLVFQIGRRIFNKGPLVNIRDGGNVWSEETRQMFSEKMKQYWSDPETRQMFSEKMKQYWSDNPEIKLQISESMKAYIENHSEFIDTLQQGKDHWIETNTDEYKKVESDRLKHCRSKEHREMQSKISKEYIKCHPEEIERLQKQGAEFWTDNEVACEQARQRAIANKSHEAIIKWLAEVPADILSEKHEKHSESMKSWYQERPEQVAQMINNRNKVLKSDEHRKKMAKRTSDYFKKHPEILTQRTNMMRLGAQKLKKIRMQCLEILRDKLVLAGEIKFCELTPNRFAKWKKIGLITKYFIDFPNKSSIKGWNSFYEKHNTISNPS